MEERVVVLYYRHDCELCEQFYQEWVKVLGYILNLYIPRYTFDYKEYTFGHRNYFGYVEVDIFPTIRFIVNGRYILYDGELIAENIIFKLLIAE